MSLLSVLIFLPLCAALLVLLVPTAYKTVYKYIAIGVSMIQLLLAVYLYTAFDTELAGVSAMDGYQFVEKLPWIRLNLGNLGTLEVDYFVGADGFSILFLLLTALVMLVAVLASWKIDKQLKGFLSLLLLLNTAIMGVFVALDFFLFYVFYEVMLLPLYFLIGIWGGVRREYAAIKFFLYTLFGSVFMLLVMVGLYFSVTDPITGNHTFNILHMMDSKNYVEGSVFSWIGNGQLFGISARLLGFIILFIAFAIKVPIVPLHTWLPDAHVEAPTPISIILAGILLKVGGYGIIRICYSIFPDIALNVAWWIGLIGVVSIIYGALNALAQQDLKRLVAYSSVSHMGFVLLGLASLTPEGISGAMFQMVSHGFLSAMLFFLVGVLYDRVHDRMIYNFRGLASIMPTYTVFVAVAFFASLGLPGFSAFIAEAFTIIGAFNAESVNGLIPRWMAIGGAVGILLSAAYFLWTLQRMFFGHTRLKGGSQWEVLLTDVNRREKLALVPMVLLALLFGIMPALVFDKINASVLSFIELVSRVNH
ncbi:NADH-quinone oxidoreductase subunit M [Olivibacter sp. CPCC 100613]|uniref:complex I subunit 4 family protein n=1 Tax=Olivibacter sp. CPCC 100613 TaxID=3079931 RepID=UPI002FF7BB23